MHKINIGITVFFFFQIIVMPLFSQQTAIPEEYSQKSLLKFIKNLDNENDYYRARSEINRFINYYPDTSLKNNLLASSWYYTFQLKEYNRIDSPSTDSVDLNNYNLLLHADALWQQNNFGELKSFLSGSSIPADNLYFTKRRFAIMLVNKEYTESETFIKNNFQNSTDAYLALIKQTQLANHHYKSMVVAGFAGIFPGGGYLYSGNIGTGVMALVIVGFYTTVTVLSFLTENYVLGGVCAGVTGAFYGGSILGGIMQTSKYNQRLQLEITYNIGETLSFSRDRRDLHKQLGLSAINGNLN